jgi:hypothetical protein
MGKEGVHMGFRWVSRREKDHLKAIGVDGRIILKWIFKKQSEGAWSDMAEDRGKWRALVNTVMNLRAT